ncbi:phosphoglycerate mutase (2,3-diphosphoglycerate-independent) [Candidatus Giovannonibacteria bacterium RIFCSPHIGHO2_01_FULL_48_47]|nr:MAG: phosphoglycerate mutase (2,3-diphosphoglycerate-independent) [Candidatus Giovannonibacteria bacterium RIFCSPHIGHO2_01_FULL_48_47]OGF67801.1 MAG: phosphoglycerate mutase (2,3-diphosphoglycerate-independent) [Candidatus Giovannonibacteria bacterium RIFCSPHIGHO2_02_FULL_48_15]OGF88556.1 MAG: phosphoglycerate mutase (2,3-diphosphoglycerate-independent) [Candidatus Giovannonibacteria bacterium RIFCSPLOWO2_01_FULL_48_47]OGF95014.1 MAG: phosphoglycerate mutase (2,3-diphosphoglycerate-independen
MVVLIILDGLGVPSSKDSTFWEAKRDNFEYLEKFFPFTTLQASGIAVGLPWGEEGNSEVGHLTLGAGKTLYHHLPRISVSIQDKTFFENKAFKKAAEHVKKTAGALHLIGLFSSGSVHAYPDHLYALLEFAKLENLPRVYLHLFTDGRDAPPKEAGTFLKEFRERLSKLYPFAKIVSIIGRDFAMDRDGDWAKIEKTHALLARGEGSLLASPVEYLESQYEKGITDEFVEPAWDGDPGSRIKKNDAVIFFNFREDSARELTQVFAETGFDKFPREKLENLVFVTMTEYQKNLPVEAAFEPMDVSWPLARILSEKGLSQLHIAETDKYAHVTYFFDGGKENPYPGEERILVPSLPGSRYEKNPAMSASQITQSVIDNLARYDFILVNFANADLVGHTGDFDATVQALEILDTEVGKIVKKVLEADGVAIITADHGNAEEKRHRLTGEKSTKHTANPVPFFLIGKKFQRKKPRSQEEIYKLYEEVGGVLSDVAPTVLELLNLTQPPEMNGVSLIERL